MSLADLFPDEDYRFSIRFERQPIAEFFRPTARHDGLMAQRRHWLENAPADHLALLPEALPLLHETLELTRSESGIPETAGLANSGLEFLKSIGAKLEPDLLFLKPNDQKQIQLLAGCVCFPSTWNLAEKIGHPIEFIHGVVPGLNPTLGTQIQSFLSKLRPGIAWLRANWGLSRSPELNQHPHRNLPRLDSQVRLDEVWLRIEHQALVSLPHSGGMLFGIRIAVHPLPAIREDRFITERLIRALKTMPEPMAQYKN